MTREQRAAVQRDRPGQVSGQDASQEVADVDPRVVHDPEEHLFRLVVDGREAGTAEYVPGVGTMAVTHVVVEPRFGGRGFGTVLAEAALEHAREQGLAVLPYCSFVREHVRRHPEHLELVPVEHRGQFGLAVS